MEDATEYSKKQRPKWSSVEETALIQMVLDREEELFGEMKGPGSKSLSKKRSEIWEDIARNLNAQFPQAKREADEIKKKFFNLKQRAKAKIDDIKKSIKKTGGGPALPPLTEAEYVLVDSLEGRPVAHGVEGGVDSDDIVTVDASAVEIASQVSTSAQMASTKDVRKEPSKRKEKNREDPETMNLLEDTKRIKLEQTKVQLEIALLEKKIKQQENKASAYEAKRLYYVMKLQNEFGLDINNVTLENVNMSEQ